MGKIVPYTKETFEKKLKEIGNEVILLGPYKNCCAKILCQCIKNKKHIWEANPCNLLKGVNCPYCDGKRVLPEESLGAKRPDLVKYFVNSNEAFQYREQSGKRVQLKCPDCGTLKELKIQELSLKGFRCPICGDGVSFPNKFIRNLLKQLGIPFFAEWNDSWCKKYKYDIMFELYGNKYLIECDGIFHYKPLKGENYLRKQKERDYIKSEKAAQNGYNLIRLNCLNVSGEAILQEILKSPLKDILDLENFDLQQCIIDSQKSITVEVWEFFNDNMDKTVVDIAKEFDLCANTVITYLKRGKELGICPYYKIKRCQTKMVSVFNMEGVPIETYDSIKSCSQKCKLEENLTERKISWALSYKNGKIGKYTFKIVKTKNDVAKNYIC